RAVLADGTSAEFAAISSAEWDHRAALRTTEGCLYRDVRRIVFQHSEEIQQRFPQILRRVSGYNLDWLADRLTRAEPTEPLSLVPLIVGSEGTLAVITEAELGVIPRPRYRGLLVPHFASLSAAMNAVAACLELGPSAVELLDQMLIDLARSNVSCRANMAAI